MSDHIASLKELFPTTAEDRLRKVAKMSCTIHGSIATLSHWNYEGIFLPKKWPRPSLLHFYKCSICV